MRLADTAGLRRSYISFNSALASLYENDLLELADATDSSRSALPEGAKNPTFDDTAFFDAAGMVYNAGGFDALQLNTPEARRLIAETVKQLNTAISSGVPHEVPEVVRYALENNAFIFSGFKAYHTLREVGLSLTTDKGDIKPFETFRKDVEQVNNRYNHNYLHTEYQFAVSSAIMADKWAQFEREADRYDLQYRTAQDNLVRPSHAILHGTTLPVHDPFWKEYFPPNGWWCRCNVVQVRKDKYSESDPDLAMLRGKNCTEAAKQQIFRFNPGKELKLFPPKHPYYKAPEAAKQVIEQQAKEREEHFAEYERLKADPNYTDVEFDLVSGGVKASHIEHNFNAVGGKYELEVQSAGYRSGHVVIFGPENSSMFKKRHTEGTWDGLQFEVAGRETATTNNIKRGLEHCADKKTTQVAVLDFPNGGFSIDKFNTALRRYMGLEKLNDGQFLRFKKIICVQMGQIVHAVEL